MKNFIFKPGLIALLALVFFVQIAWAVDKKISELPEVTAVDESADWLVIVDTSGNFTGRLKPQNLFGQGLALTDSVQFGNVTVSGVNTHYGWYTATNTGSYADCSAGRYGWNWIDGVKYSCENGTNAKFIPNSDLDANGHLIYGSSLTDSHITGKLLTGFSSGAGTVSGTDSILQAINKLDGNIAGKQAAGVDTIPRVAAGGTVDAITANYSPDITLSDLRMVAFRASGANTSTTPSFAPDGLTAHTIVKKGGSVLLAGDIPAAGAIMIVQYDLSNTRWELLNPAFPQIPYASNPAMDGAAATGSSPNYSRGDHVHPTDTSRAAVSDFDITGSGMTTGYAYYQGTSALVAADATSSATLPSPAICVAISATVCRTHGLLTTTGLTKGSVYYVPVATGGGALTATAPSSSGNQLQRIGVALSTTTLQIMPSLDVGGI